MKKIYYISDIHLEINGHLPILKLYKNVTVDKENSILILAGDSIVLSQKFLLEKLYILFKKFSEVYLICGNHEFYDKSSNSAMLLTSFVEEHKYYKIVNNVNIPFGDYNLIFTSLFSEIKPSNEYFIMRGLNDFRRIKFNDHIITPEDFNLIYKTAKEFIAAEIVKSEKNIVITHHLPTEKVANPYFANSAINNAFFSEMHDFIYDNSKKIKYWIFGHSHYNTESLINETMLISNQLGYVGERINSPATIKYIVI